MGNAQLQSLSEHAKQRLDRKKTANLDRKDKLELYKRFLKTEEHRILLYHRSGGSALRVSKRRADLIKILLRHLYRDAVDSSKNNKPDVTLVAIGGFGRGRLNPCSDVDLLFLHPKGAKGLPKEASELIESILYMLYDCGFKVGHAVRSIKETISEANTDDRTKSSMIESKILFGDEDLYKSMMNEFYKNCIKGFEKDYLKKRLEDIRLRHLKWSQTPFLQEPHIKEGCGGLRDYHNLIWINYVRRKSTDFKDLVKSKMLTESDYKKIEVGARAMGATTSEIAETIIQDKTTREAATGDVFEQKKDWKESSAYDLSPIDEGNLLRDYQEDVMQNRFPDTTIEDRLSTSGV